MARLGSLIVVLAVAVANAACGGGQASSNVNPPPPPSAAPPAITAPPANQTVTAGQSAQFSVSATGSAPMTYQWRKNGAAIAGATSASYTTSATTPADNGSQFAVVISNAAGTVTSSPATLTVNASPAAVQVATNSLPNGQSQSAYNATLQASGGTAPYTWTVLSGTLPTGLSLSSSGVISGTPSVAGAFTFTVQVRDSVGSTASSTLSINIATVAAPVVAISTPAAGATVSAMLNVSGTASSSVGLSAVQVSLDGGSYSNASGTSSWSFSVDTTTLSNGTHTLVARATDTAGTSTTSAPVSVVVNNSGVATDCTLYASATGNNNNSGTTATAPKTFQGAANAAQPGAVICVLGGNYAWTGSFYPPRSGTANAWIVYKAYGDSPVKITYTGTSANWTAIFHTGNHTFPNGPSYLEFNGFHLDGRNQAVDGFYCNGGHHIRIKNNTMENFGAAGIATLRCDYITAENNVINHVGYGEGWSSGISLNSNQWFDSYGGFHNIVANNVIAGSYDGSSYHTDGNGIIMDLGGTTPPVLIVNNVVYGNGGRCIQALSNTNFWIVNNTCYKNGLDTADSFGSLVTQNASNGYFINNIGVGWNGRRVYEQQGSAANVQYFAGLYWNGSNNFTNPQLFQADPLFINPPYFHPTNGGQYATALPATQIGNGLMLQSASPARGRGIDPSTLPNLPSAIVTDLRKYIYRDIKGKARPQGGAFDLGAYQF